MYNLIYKAIGTCLEFRELDVPEMSPETVIGDLLDSMGRLEILLVLEDHGLDVNHINVQEIVTIEDLAKQLL